MRVVGDDGDLDTVDESVQDEGLRDAMDLATVCHCPFLFFFLGIVVRERGGGGAREGDERY